MKEYSILEVSAMLLENPDVVFEEIGATHKGRFILSDNDCIIETNEGRSYFSSIILTNPILKAKFRKVEQEITLDEAIKAHGEGKKIRCEYPDFNKPSKVVKVCYWKDLDGGCKRNGSDNADEITFYTLTTGKWYIEEDE